MAVGRVFPNEIDRIFNAPGGPIGKEARKTALEIAEMGRYIAESELGKNPNDQPRTGQFARGFEVRVVGRSTQFEVRNRRPYAAALEKGAKPHRIEAKRVSHLRFRDRSGRWRQVKFVKHPGNPAYKVLERAAIRVVQQRYGTITIS